MTSNSFQKTLYNRLILPVGYGLATAVKPFHSKLRETLGGRRNARARWEAAGKKLHGKPVWFHISSVGEFEQAKPVIAALHERHPDIPVALSMTSPSGFNYAVATEGANGQSNIKFIDYLPIDFIENVQFCLSALSPRLLVFVKFDLWPNLIWEASSKKIPSVLIDASLSETSHRFSRIGRRFYRSVYSYLAKILAVSQDDAERFHTCVPGHSGISVAGDTRFDRVLERRSAARAPAFNVAGDNRFVIVAGSTWPSDEAHLLEPLARLAREEDSVLLVIVPHEPTPGRVAELTNWATENKLRTTLLSQINGAPVDGHRVIIVDKVGVLAELYQSGNAAYVGGSFSTGVHSVIEPAIMGIPVLFGPTHKNSFEAIQLIKNDAAFEVKNRDDVYTRFKSLLDDKGKSKRMGETARAFVESQLGATERCMDAISEYI